jgi:tetratricopeptide (TPR) repeat protein
MAASTRAFTAATIVMVAMLAATPAVACKDDFDRVTQDEDQQERLDWKFAQPFNNRCAAYLRQGDTTVPCRTATRRSGSIRKMPSPSAIEVSLIPARATSTAPSKTTTRRYGSIPLSLAPATTALTPLNRSSSTTVRLPITMRSFRIQATDARAWNNRCWTRAIVGQLVAALADCNGSLRLNPSSANALDSRAFVHLKLGDLDHSIADYDAALQINPQFATSLYGRGLAKRELGDHAGGDADIAAAVAIKPDIAQEFVRYGLR